MTIEFYGSDLVVQWSGTGGTLDLSADQRAFSFKPSIQMDDNSTGSAGAKTYLTRQTDFTASYKALWQKGTFAATANVEDVLAVGQNGTLYVYPQGSAAGYRKYTLPVISQGAALDLQYTSITEFNCSFQGNGTFTLGTA